MNPDRSADTARLLPDPLVFGRRAVRPALLAVVVVVRLPVRGVRSAAALLSLGLRSLVHTHIFSCQSNFALNRTEPTPGSHTFQPGAARGEKISHRHSITGDQSDGDVSDG